MLALALLSYRSRRGLRHVSWVSIAVSTFTVLFFSGAFRMAELIAHGVFEFDYALKEVWVSNEANPGKSSGRLLSLLDLDSLLQMGDVTGITVDKYTTVDISALSFEGIPLTPPGLPLHGVKPEYDTFTRARLESCLARNASFKAIISGRDLEVGDENSCLVYYETSNQFDLTDDELIGRVFNLTTSDGRAVDIKVVGVYDKMIGSNALLPEDEESYEFVGKGYGPDGNLSAMPHDFILSWDVIEKINGNEDDGKFSVLLSAADPESAVQLYGELDSKLMNIVACEYQNMNSAVENLRLFGSLFIFIGGVLSLLCALNLYSAALAQASARRQWFALLDVLGFRKSRSATSYSIEVLLALVRGFISAFLASALLLTVLGLALSQTVSGFIFAIDMALPDRGVLISLVGSAVLIYALILLSISFKVRGIDTVSSLG